MHCKSSIFLTKDSVFGYKVIRQRVDHLMSQVQGVRQEITVVSPGKIGGNKW